MTNLTDGLAVLPNPQRRALDIVKGVAEEKGCRPYLVGGPVRDLLLGRQVIDIDLTLEDGASTLARSLAKAINGRVRSFPQFLTYKVTAVDLPEIDIATARKEKYRGPGALPTVTAGKLKDDLLRRDFSINALALDLAHGTLHDPSGGERDLRDRVVRVLHDESFADDPTRIFRAVRLATRLGFTFDLHTGALLRTAIAAGALGNVSRERIWRELFLAFDETEAPQIVESLHHLSALDILFGERPVDLSLRERLETVQRQADGDPQLDREVMFIAALLHGNASPLDLEGSGFSQKRTRNVVQIANELGRFQEGLAEANDDRQRFQLLRNATAEARSVLAATVPDERATIVRFGEYEKFQLPLRGNDLEVPPGPHVAQALERTREAVFAGEIDAADARTYARRVAKEMLGAAEPPPAAALNSEESVD
jgi:tRNA nucleotidyltransferase (CCA-adding enzyme)